MNRVEATGLWALKLGVGALLVAAGVLKLGDPGAFAGDIANYQLAPRLAPHGAAILPSLEVIAGLVLMLSPLRSRWMPAAAVVALGLFGLFTSALSYVLAAGIDVNCGCFGGDSSPASWWST